MQVRFATPSLHAVDDESARLLILTFFADDRPLQGLPGLVDWRLNGRISKLIRTEFVDGHFREATLRPLDRRLPFAEVLLIGLGERADYDAERFETICRFAFGTVARLGTLDLAMQLPGRIGLDVGLREAVRGWQRALVASFTPAELAELRICLLDAPEVQRELAEPLRRVAASFGDARAEAVELDDLGPAGGTLRSVQRIGNS